MRNLRRRSARAISQLASTIEAGERSALAAHERLAELLGLPIDDWHEYGHWMDAAVRTNNPHALAEDRAVVDHMRVFGRRSEIEQQLFNPASAIEGTLSLLAEGMRGKGVDLHISETGFTVQVRGYVDQLEQVLINLMVNARDALPKGGNIWVTTYPAYSNGNLKLDTGTLGFSDIAGKDKEHGYYLNVGGTYSSGSGTTQDSSQVGKGKEGETGWSVSGWDYQKDREQIVRATVGAGEIVVRGPMVTDSIQRCKGICAGVR